MKVKRNREKAKEIAKNKMHFDSDGFGTVDIDDVIDVMLECLSSVNNSLLLRSEKIELLEKYSKFLEEHGYTDTDWRAEEPFAIDEFLKGK